MEFPELGTHCSSPICSRLDFLPIECDACHKIFCKDHSPYAQHNCELSYTKDARVPVCPLCNQPVPINRGEDPNIKVNFHIQNECKSEKAKTNSNRCTVAGCKKKELVPVKCNTCQKNFCLKHRFETDHNCQGHPQRLGGKNISTRGQQTRSPASIQSKQERGIVRSGNPQKTTLSHIGADLNRERMMRLQNTAPSTSTRPLQPNMGEDEALAHAIAASIVEGPTTTSSLHPPPPAHHHLSQTQGSSTAAATAMSRDEDEDLARAIAASLNEEEQPKPKPKTRTSSSKHHQGRNTENDFCTVS